MVVVVSTHRGGERVCAQLRDLLRQREPGHEVARARARRERAVAERVRRGAGRHVRRGGGGGSGAAAEAAGPDDGSDERRFHILIVKFTLTYFYLRYGVTHF